MKKNRSIFIIVSFICLLIVCFFLFFWSKSSPNKFVNKYSEVSYLLSYIENRDTVYISEFNNLYRTLFLSKISDSLISFCSIDNAKGNDFLLIISPDSIAVFEEPDLYAFFTMHSIIISNNTSENLLDSMLLKIKSELDLIFEQKQRKYYRIIGLSKEKSNRIIHIDNFEGYFTASGYCHTTTVKNNLFHFNNCVFLSDLNPKFINRGWRLPFSDNLVSKDSILTRMKNINNCKDSINRRIYPRNDL